MSPVGAQGSGGVGGVDLAAVARDDQLLDLLAARAEAPTDDADDMVVALLAAFAEEVDDGLDELLAELAERESVAPAERIGVRRGRGLRVTTMALVVGATLSVSGVAAAVTGDPLAPYKGLVSAVAGEDQLPEQAARVAALNRALRGTRAQIAHGDLAGAREHLDALTSRLASMTDLSRGERKALEARIAALEAALARAEAKPPSGKPADAGKPTSAPGQDRARPTDAGKPEDAGTSGQGKGGGANDEPGRQGTGGAAENAKPSKAPQNSAGQGADEQGSADTSVAPDDQSAGSGDESVAADDPTADDQGGTGTDQNGTGTVGTPTDRESSSGGEAQGQNGD